MYRLAYNTNGLAHHRLLDALRLLADLGYEGVAITPDVGQLDPLEPDPRLIEDVRRWSERLGLELAVETGARYVLDPRRKHWPSLLEPVAEHRARRIAMVERSIDIAEQIGAPLVSIWAGVAPGGEVGDRRDGTRASEGTWQLLIDGLCALLDYGGERGIQIAFEPEPGMFVERPSGYLELVARMGARGDTLGLTLDVGHLLVTGDLPVEKQIRNLAPRLVHVHLDDIHGALHEHLMFGAGVLDLPATLRALAEIGYDGMAAVELSRDSHRGAWAAQEALARLKAAMSRTS